MRMTFLYILILLNVFSFILTGIDKRKARKKRWRVPEAVFFLLSAIGAGIGIYAGMFLFHHKTKKWYFLIGIPSITVLVYAIFLKSL